MTHRVRRPGSSGGTARLLNTELPDYTVASLQALAVRPKHLVYVIDGASNKRVAVGADVWRYLDGTAV